MERVSSAYEALLRGKIFPQDGNVPFFSSVTGDVILDGKHVGPAYWVQNLVSPVRFSTAVTKVVETVDARKVFLEVGPHSALSGPLRQSLDSLGSRKDEYVSTLTRASDSFADILRASGSLWLLGTPLAYESITGRGRSLVDLPLYPWHYEEPLWRESRLSSGYRFRQFPHHDLLGTRVIESTDEFPSWRNILRPDNVDWLLQYEIGCGTIFPATGYVCMAGEAVRQITETETNGFIVRDVQIKSNLVLQPGQEVEIITQFRRLAANRSMEFSWYEFSVSSLDASRDWIKHVAGQVRKRDEFTLAYTAPEMAVLPRLTSREDWYGKLRTKQMRYGPRFSGLIDMRTHITERHAVATTINDSRCGESLYMIHPTAIDCMFQVLHLADLIGLTRHLGSAKLPTYIAEMTVRPAPLQSRLLIAARCDSRTGLRNISGNVLAMCDGDIVTEVKDLQLSALDDAGVNQRAGSTQPSQTDAVLVWKEDLNLLDASSLIHSVEDRAELHKILDQFAAACIVEAAEKTRNIEPVHPYLTRYASWLQTVSNEIRQGSYSGLSYLDARAAFTDRQVVLENLRPILQHTAAAPAAEAIWRVMNNCRDIMMGQVDVLDLLLEGRVLHELYNFMSNSDTSAFLDLLAHRKPGLRVLEIGAGTGGTTATVLPSLHLAPNGRRMYQTYVYTDVSSGFFHTARDRFKEYAGIEFAVLDISKDPLAQGFVPESFDLIIACNVSRGNI